MSPDDFDPKRFALLADFRDDDRDALLELLEPQKLATGRKLFREGSESEGLIFLAAGRVEIKGKRSEGSAELGPGTVFGTLSMMAGGTHESTVSTLETCEVWRLPRGTWLRLVEDSPRTACRLAEAILAETAGRVRGSLDALGDARVDV